VGELSSAVDARRFIGIALNGYSFAALCGGDVDDIGQVILPGRIGVGDLAQPAE